MKIHLRRYYSSGEALPAEVSAWLAKGTTEGYTIPGSTVQNALGVFVTSLKADGLFTRMKTGYIMHAGSAQMGTLNLKDPDTYQTSLVNSPTFSEGNGMKSNGTTSYINQPFKSNEYAGIESDLTVIQYISESSTTFGDLASHGFRTQELSPGRYFLITPLKTATTGQVFGFHEGVGPSFSSVNHKGLYVFRNNGTQDITYKDGTKTVNAFTSVAPVLSQNRLILAFNNDTGTGVTPAQFYTKYIAADFLFDAFDDTDELNFRTAFNTYKTAVGLP